MIDLTVLTCTGGRPEAFALCELYMSRQTRPFRWIVVDDVEDPTPCTMGQIVIRRTPFWTPGSQNTLAANLIAGLSAIGRPAGGIVIVEDDDWYHPSWLEFVGRELEGEMPLVGEGWTRYYHVGFRCFRRNQNARHASLCATAFRSEVIPKVIEIAAELKGTYIDMALFKAMPTMATILDTNYVVGLKGLPGRPGTTKAHATMETRHEAKDPNLSKLREWIGEDAARYSKFGFSGRPIKDAAPEGRRETPREKRRRVIAERRAQKHIVETQPAKKAKGRPVSTVISQMTPTRRSKRHGR